MVYNKRVIHIIISSKKRDSLSWCLHSFGPDRDWSESGFPEQITISITLLHYDWTHQIIFLRWLQNLILLRDCIFCHYRSYRLYSEPHWRRPRCYRSRLWRRSYVSYTFVTSTWSWISHTCTHIINKKRPWHFRKRIEHISFIFFIIIFYLL